MFSRTCFQSLTSRFLEKLIYRIHIFVDLNSVITQLFYDNVFPFGVWAVELQFNITISVSIRIKHNHNYTKQQHTTISGRLHADFSLSCCFPVHLVFIAQRLIDCPNRYDTPLYMPLYGKPFALIIVKVSAHRVRNFRQKFLHVKK